MDWEEELNKAVEEGRDGITFAEWLLKDTNQDYFPILDKIEEMSNIKDMPKGMIPSIEVRSYDISCKILYNTLPSDEGMFVFFAQTRQLNKVVRTLGGHALLKDMKAEASYPVNVLSRARDDIEELAEKLNLPSQIYGSRCFYLSLEQEFYDREASGYFMHLPCEER